MFLVETGEGRMFTTCKHHWFSAYLAVSESHGWHGEGPLGQVSQCPVRPFSIEVPPLGARLEDFTLQLPKPPNVSMIPNIYCLTHQQS